MHRRLARMLVCCVWLVCGACSSQPTSPGGALDGTWSGTLTGDDGGTGSAKLVLTQRGAGVSGTFAITPPGSEERAGVAGGTLAASVVLLTFTPSAPLVCSPAVTFSGVMSATMAVAGDRMTGTYSSFTCGGAIGGTIDVRRQ